MNFKYDKDSLKENLTIDEIFDLVNELGGEPVMKNGFFISKTICHNLDLSQASHKLYYYDNSHLFYCYTECDPPSFDIYELILKINKLAGIQNFTLSKAINFVARYFGYNTDTFYFDTDINVSDDWKLINNFKRKKEEVRRTPVVEMKIYDEKILRYLPQPHIIPWENEGISFDIIKSRNIKYNPISESIIIPHYDINNNLIGIRERTLIKDLEKNGKYKPAILNGQMYNHPLGFNLFNLNNSKKAISKMGAAIVFEGKR